MTYKLEWEYIGEGYRGEYNPADDTDHQLMRFTLLDENGEPVSDASYCTLVRRKFVTDNQLAVGAKIILDKLLSADSIKKEAEYLSWVCDKDLVEWEAKHG